MHTLSLASFHSLDSTAQEAILLGLYAREGALSDREAAERLGWERGNVSARRNGLIKRKLVVELGQKKDRTTGRRVAAWGIVKETLGI